MIDEDKVFNSTVEAEYSLDNNNKSRARIKAGTGTINNDKEKAFIIDSDFIYKDTIECEKSMDILNTLHCHAKEYIDSAITKKLNDAMDPEPVKNE